MTKLIIPLSMINFNLFSTMYAWQPEVLQQKKLYQELDLESLKSRHWFRTLCHFYKIFNEKYPSYLYNLIPNFNRVHNTRPSYNIPLIKINMIILKAIFFLLLYQNGTSMTSTLEIQQALILLKRNF